MLIEIDFGQEAIQYIKEQLSQGNTLARYGLSMRLQEGHVISYLPPAVSPVARRDFRNAFSIATDQTYAIELDAKILDLVSAYLAQPGKRYAVIETYFEPDWPVLASLHLPYFIHGSEVYFFFSSQDHSHEMISQALHSARDYPFIGALTSLPSTEADVQIKEELTANIMEHLAARTEHLLIGAYDAIGYLIWSKGQMPHE